MAEIHADASLCILDAITSGSHSGRLGRRWQPKSSRAGCRSWWMVPMCRSRSSVARPRVRLVCGQPPQMGWCSTWCSGSVRGSGTSGKDFCSAYEPSLERRPLAFFSLDRHQGLVAGWPPGSLGPYGGVVWWVGGSPRLPAGGSQAVDEAFTMAFGTEASLQSPPEPQCVRVPFSTSLQGIDCLKFEHDFDQRFGLRVPMHALSDQTMVRVSIHLHTELEDIFALGEAIMACAF